MVILSVFFNFLSILINFFWLRVPFRRLNNVIYTSSFLLVRSLIWRLFFPTWRLFKIWIAESIYNILLARLRVFLPLRVIIEVRIILFFIIWSWSCLLFSFWTILWFIMIILVYLRLLYWWLREITLLLSSCSLLCPFPNLKILIILPSRKVIKILHFLIFLDFLINFLLILCLFSFPLLIILFLPH